MAVTLLLGGATAFRPYVGTAPWHKDVNHPSHEVPDFDHDYFVPNFGVDQDIIATHKNIAAAENKYKHKMHATFKKPKGHPVDYFVPNFGVDHDIKATTTNI
jgi:hypothetical protein